MEAMKLYNAIPLSYSYNALTPTIDEETVNIHYNKHHKKYVENLNKLIPSSNIPLEQIPQRIEEFSLKDRGQILYNAGGILNHNLYWQSLSHTPSIPKSKLLNKINNTYGSFDNLKNIFIKKAQNLVGSGYTFLVADHEGNLTIMNLPNQETPLSYDLIPLFNIDLWEHAYYLKYRNNCNSYIENIWNKTNFDYASTLYENLF